MNLPEKQALLILCEGDHDVVLIRKLLKEHLSFNEEKWRFSQFPSPFNSIFPARMKDHTANDLELGLAHEFFLPNYVLSKGDQLIMLFKTGGDRKTELAKDFLGNLTKFMTKGDMFPRPTNETPSAMIREITYLFVFDADDKGPQKIRERAWNDYHKLGSQIWLNTPWQVASSNPLAATSDNKAIYIWSADGNVGTIEDLFYPVFEQDLVILTKSASTFTDDYLGPHAETVAAQAKRKKSIMTIAGQEAKPGHGLHLILKEGHLVSLKTLLTVPAVIEFVTFIKNLLKLE